MKEIWVLFVITSTSQNARLNAGEFDPSFDVFDDYEKAKAAFDTKREELKFSEKFHIALKKGNYHN